MLCSELHQQEDRPEGRCTQELRESDVWKFCPTCGRITGHLLVEKADGRLNTPLQTPVTRTLTLHNAGWTPVNVVLDLETSLPGVQLGTRQMRSLVVNPRMGQQVEM